MFGVETICNIPIMQVKVEAHSGRTDANGGHKDNKNKSGLGSYHYHCGGYPAHLHQDGVCPYATSGTKNTTTVKSEKSIDTTDTTKSKIGKNDVKKVQEALNLLGYDCGTPDGICGTTTKKQIKKYQEDIGVTIDGKIDEELMDVLGI